LAQARETPCMSCATSPCCVHVPLHTFQIRSLVDLDHALYMLNFDRILLGLSVTGDWSVYYRYPCRFLDRSNPGNYLCSIHASALQPQICVHYNPYHCWYRRALTDDPGDQFMRIDRRRMERIAELLEFDDRRAIVSTPDWSRLVEIAASLPIEPDYGTPPEPEPVFEQWLAETALGVESRVPSRRRGYHDFADQCTGCAAYCCKSLVFPHGRPTTRRNLDYLQFALGFPGIEVGVSDGDWMLIVKARCRHLTQDNRCGVYGQPERPTLCRYYDATNCTYVTQFGVPRPRGFMRIQLEQFFSVAEACTFDDNGTIVSMPGVDELRDLVEARWAADVAEAGGADDSGAKTDGAPDVPVTALTRAKRGSEGGADTADDSGANP
jgi:Fe-S-cluster containining protein